MKRTKNLKKWVIPEPSFSDYSYTQIAKSILRPLPMNNYPIKLNLAKFPYVIELKVKKRKRTKKETEALRKIGAL